MKMVLNCVHIWSVDLFLVEDKAPERVFVGMQQHKVGTMPTGLVWNCWLTSANHARPVGLFFPSQAFVLLPPSSQGCEFLVSAQAVPGHGEWTQMSCTSVWSSCLQPEGDGCRRGWVQRKLPGRAVTRGQQCWCRHVHSSHVDSLNRPTLPGAGAGLFEWPDGG